MSAMKFSGTTQRAMGTTDATLDHGQWQPTGGNHGQSTSTAEQDLWVCQLDAIDENANPNWYGLVNANNTYTPLT